MAKNDIAQSCNNGYEGTFDGESAKNLSDLASDAPGIGSINEAVLTFADSSSFNYHLNVSDTAAIGQGVKLSSDTGLSFSIDIDNENRGNTWDIGADQKDESTDDITPPVIPSGLRIY